MVDIWDPRAVWAVWTDLEDRDSTDRREVAVDVRVAHLPFAAAPQISPAGTLCEVSAVWRADANFFIRTTITAHQCLNKEEYWKASKILRSLAILYDSGL